MSTHVEHRICGESEKRGSWQGSWRPYSNPTNDLGDLTKGNEKVWIERRRVTISNITRENVKPDAAHPTES